MLRKITLALSLFTLTACASSPDKDPQVPGNEPRPPEVDGDTPAPDNPLEPPAVEGEEETAWKSWSELKGRERGAYMKEVVVPVMGELFKAHNPDEFAEVNCKTCHGKDPKAAEFKMPSPDLHKLDPADSFAAEKQDHPGDVKFMMELVVPRMAELLGKEPFDPATGEGFGCFDCHLRK